MRHIAYVLVLCLILAGVVLAGGDHDHGHKPHTTEAEQAHEAENAHEDDHAHDADIAHDNDHDNDAGHSHDADIAYEDDHAHNGGHAHEDGAPSVAVTLWTSKMELFIEYPVAVANTPGRYIIHLTILDGFQPVREGSVTLTFTESGGHAHEITATELLREGIFAPTVELHHSGEYEFSLRYEGSGIEDAFTIPDFEVFASEQDIPAIGDDAGGEIGFLKEQQWKIPFSTAEAETREIKKSVWAIGEVLPDPTAYIQITSPVDGIIHAGDARQLALPGSLVKKGDVVATLATAVHGNSWLNAQLAFEQAKRDYERAQRLKASQAISAREYEQIENEYRSLKAAFDALPANGGGEKLQLTAPISGRIVEWNVRSGQQVSVGDKLMAIVDPSSVWLKVNVFENDHRKLGTPVGAYVKTGPNGDGTSFSDNDLRVLTTGGELDPASRTVPVILQIVNRDDHLKINETAPVELYAVEGDHAVSVPRTAIYDEDGMPVVYVQTGGESFEKRVVKVGPHYMGWTTIYDGVQPGERVVSTGGYLVKLASTTAEIGHGHAH